jgi:hypothetical protein
MTPLEALAPTQTEWGSSRYAEWQRCQVAHDLRYIQGIRPTSEPDYFGIGTLVHAALAYVADGAMRHTKPHRWEDVVKAAQTQDPPPPEFVIEESSRLLKAYFQRWGHENAGWSAVDIISIEREFTAPAPNSFRYSGRIDMLLEIDGQIMIVDTKTTSRNYGSNYDEIRRELTTRSQFLGLSWLVQNAFGLREPPAIIVNLIVKTKVPQFDRIWAPITQKQLALWVETQRQNYQVFDLLSARKPIRNYSACAPGYSPRCWAFDWCHGTNEQHERLYRIEKKP